VRIVIHQGAEHKNCTSHFSHAQSAKLMLSSFKIGHGTTISEYALDMRGFWREREYPHILKSGQPWLNLLRFVSWIVRPGNEQRRQEVCLCRRDNILYTSKDYRRLDDRRSLLGLDVDLLL